MVERNEVVNSPAYKSVVEGLARLCRNDARALRRLDGIAAGMVSAAKLMHEEPELVTAEVDELASRLRAVPRVPAWVPADRALVAVIRDAIVIAAMAEHGDEMATMQLGAAWAKPVLDSGRDPDEVTIALRLASAAHEMSEIAPGESCCAKCAIEPPEPATTAGRCDSATCARAW